MNTHSTSFSSHYDIIIVGARVAGAGLGLQTARAGLRTLVIDRDPPGRDTLSTHAMMRGGVMILNRWGILPRVEEMNTPAIRQTTFHYGEERFPVFIKERSGVDALYSPRRYVLDTILAEAASQAGADVRHRTRFEDVLRNEDGRVCGIRLAGPDGVSRTVSADLVVGADGIDSRVAAACGSETLHEAENRSGVIFSYWKNIPLDGTHWFYGTKSAAGAIPTNGGCCVFTSFRPERLEGIKSSALPQLFREVLSEVNPDFAAYLRHGTLDGGYIKFKGRTGFMRRICGPGWALVGDAACFKDPITAHGMTDALRDANELARAIVEDTPQAWQEFEAGHERFARSFVDLSDQIATYRMPLPELQSAHKVLSKLMNEECDYIERDDTAPAAACPALAMAVNG